ncbi:MAG TPA: hypothetical protein VME46_09965 [Acidimicrobiales bacterium]|nr:hypothetical protein [Acidimicrobiales bacterium]
MASQMELGRTIVVVLVVRFTRVPQLPGRPPPTPDDVSITDDGRRLDSAEAVIAWWAEFEADLAPAQVLRELAGNAPQRAIWV